MPGTTVDTKPAAAPTPAAAPAPAAPGAARRLYRSMGAYGVFCAALVLLYCGVEARGWGFQPGAKVDTPMSVRQSPGGYRSYHFWHSGLHGGK